jgi:uncharacterized protein (TIGR04255 family)
MAHVYRRAPITEAVIEIRVQDPIDRELVDRAQKRALSEFPLSEELANVGFTVEFPTQVARAKIQHDWAGYKLSNIDRTDFLSLGPNIFNVSRLPPYPGWEAFRLGARQQWDQWKRIVGYQKIVRIGVRYINRIDVPPTGRMSLDVEDYLTFHLTLPKIDLPPMSNFTVHARMPLGSDDCDVALNSGATPSPLIGHASFILDLDLSREKEVPQRDDDLWALIERMREHKNRIFEACITDKARELFSR